MSRNQSLPQNINKLGKTFMIRLASDFFQILSTVNTVTACHLKHCNFDSILTNMTQINVITVSLKLAT